MKRPACALAKPCGSCPYRRDVPSGVWDPTEYLKLPRYDADTFAQPVEVFMCHAQNGAVCSGWLGFSDPSQLLAVRLGIRVGHLDPGCASYTTDVPLFSSGAEAAAHGMKEVPAPRARARDVINKLTRARARRRSP